jgi:uncharacterized protein
MTILTITLLVAAGSFLAGLLGSMTGIGGGLIIVPMLTLLFNVDLRYAIGASLVSIIATSSGAAAAFVREGFTNVRIGVVLEVATTVGALIGAVIAGVTPTNVLSILLGCVLLFSAYRSIKGRSEHDLAKAPDQWAERLRLNSSYPTAKGMQPYAVQNVPAGFALMFLAGILSAMLGIGSGIIKVLAMDQLMRLPFKVSTTTSNFMIGVTAAASAGVYLHRGQIDPVIVFPVMLGVLGGALVGARILTHAPVKPLRILFTTVVVVMATLMLYKGIVGTV